MKKHHNTAAENNLQIDSSLRFQISEAYKLARTNLMFSLLKEGCKKIVVSSSVSGEGKTTTAVHLAISLAQMNARVLLIDADLRKPKVNQFFSFNNTPGLTNYFGHQFELQKILHNTDYDSLSVICSGVMVPNPSELLASEKMTALLAELESQYDYIVIDTPPVNIVADALPLVKQCDGVVLVVRRGFSTYPELNKTIKNLEMINAKILGVIFNSAASGGKGNYRYGNGKYGYGYGNYGY